MKIMAEDLFDDVFNNVLRAPVFGGETLMKTDITENDGRYYLDIELPGFNKEEVKISLYNGDLTVEANRNTAARAGKLLRQERYSGNCQPYILCRYSIERIGYSRMPSRTVYLTVDFPTEQKKQEEEKKFIEILLISKWM
jgi:HSP20 family protein